MKKRKIAGICAGLLCMSVMLAGCGTQAKASAVVTPVPTETPTPTPEVVTPTPEPLKTIGVQAEGAFEVKLKNATGKVIKGVTVKLTQDAEFPENLLAQDDTFAVDEQRILYYKQPEGTQQEQDVNGMLVTQGYDIQLTFEDEAVKVLHSFPFEDIAEGEIHLEEEIAFITYTSVSTKTEVSTKEAEKAAAEQSGAQVAGTDVTEYYPEDSYEEPSYYYEDESGSYDYESDYEPDYEEDYDTGYDDSYDYDEGGDDAGGDSCLDDGLTW